MIAPAVTTSFLVSLCCALLLLSPRIRRFALDHPNERSLHERPVPRTGGIAVLAGAATALGFGAGSMWLALTLALALAAVSLLDDIFGMPAWLRLACHGAAAAVLVWHAAGSAAPAEIVLLVLGVAWITNLYNFMDGSDGLAGGMSVLGFGTYALAAELAGADAMAIVSSATAAASLAFLLLNFHPARIFLGDVGSIPLGFLAGGLGLVGWSDGLWPLWFPLLVFGPFIGDATLTLARRLARRERVWQAHRDHYYQRLVRMGFGHRGTAWIAYAATAACAAGALYGRNQPPAVQAAVFAVGSGILAAIAVWVDVKWARFRGAGSKA